MKTEIIKFRNDEDDEELTLRVPEGTTGFVRHEGMVYVRSDEGIPILVGGRVVGYNRNFKPNDPEVYDYLGPLDDLLEGE